jgi:ABC-type multidrug transport system ATPase subunit
MYKARKGEDLVILKDVKKSFGRNLIFEGVNMEIDTGKPVVLMGSNGCGKSTLLRIIADLLACTSGEVVRKPGVKISYVPDRFPKVPFKVEDYLLHMGSIQGMKPEDVKKYADEQFKLLNIPQHIRRQRVSKCSKGTIQKINIMQALMVKPDLLILDEPFSGLDEASVEGLVQLLKGLEGTALVLACHQKELAQQISDKIFVFREGRVFRYEAKSESD